MLTFYDEKGNIRTFKPSYLNSGDKGIVYKVDEDTCLKVFYAEYLERWHPNNHVLEVIRELGLSKIYEIYDFLYDSKGNYISYLMKYYQQEDVDLFECETSFILDSFTSIDSSVITLAENNICLCDMHGKNVIVNRSGITLIDLDESYFEHGWERERIIKNNRKEVAEVFKGIFDASLVPYHGKIITSRTDYRTIGDLSRGYIENGIDHLYKELEGHKYMIDYVRKKTR